MMISSTAPNAPRPDVRPRHHPIPALHNRGFTLVELVIAIVMTALVVTSALYAWQSVAKHTTNERRKSILESELDAYARALVMQIRQSPRVLGYDENSISFVSAATGNACEYRFTNDTLYQDGIPVALAAQAARLNQFLVRPGDDSQLSGQKKILLLVTLRAEDTFGNSRTASLSVAIDQPPVDTLSGGGSWNW